VSGWEWAALVLGAIAVALLWALPTDDDRKK
jgi:hypothetical protein